MSSAFSWPMTQSMAGPSSVASAAVPRKKSGFGLVFARRPPYNTIAMQVIATHPNNEPAGGAHPAGAARLVAVTVAPAEPPRPSETAGRAAPFLKGHGT